MKPYRLKTTNAHPSSYNPSMRYALLFGLALLLSACTYTYIPPIPRTEATPPPTFTVAPSSQLFREATGLRLSLRVTEVPTAGWVAVQWLSPRNQEVASDSIWFEASSNPQTTDFALPDDVTLTPGEWRAVVTYGGQVARQFSLAVE